MTKRRVLVTNDDGIDGEGLHVLVASLVAGGYAPIVVAPNAEYSGAGTSIVGMASASPMIGMERRTLPASPDVEAWALDGPPALCVLAMLRGAFGALPDYVASGVNYGLNTGPAVMHSGTVSAAMTAKRWNIPGVAVSAEYNSIEDGPLRFDTAADLAVKLLDQLVPGSDTVLNLNVPCCAVDDLAGVVAAPLAPRSRYASKVESTDGGVLAMSYSITDAVVPDGTDTDMIEKGFATVTSLEAIRGTDASALVAGLIAAD